MQRILICQNTSGSASFPTEVIEGLPAPVRIYLIVNGKLILSGYPDAILQHDLEELLQIPGGLYRLPTPAEQEQMAREEEQAGMIQESGQASDESNAGTPPALNIQPQEAEESASSRKKASGG